MLAVLVLGVDGREPDSPRALPGRDLDGERVHSADGGVERDRAERRHLGDDAADDGSPLGGRAVVRLEDEAGEPELGEAVRERDVVDLPLDDVGRDVDVGVEGAAEKLPGALGRDKVGHVGDTR